MLINEPKLDLACGDNCKEDYKGVDIVKTSSVDYVVDLQSYPWPIESNSAEEIYCSNYIEHIKHDNVALDLKQVVDKSNTFEEFKVNINNEEFLRPKDGFIKFINELYRIMKPGAKARITAPYYSSMRAVGDPTHVRHICNDSFLYVVKEWMERERLSHYGIAADFDVRISYYITNEMTLKSEEVREKAFKHDLNVIEDLIVDLIKK